MTRNCGACGLETYLQICNACLYGTITRLLSSRSLLDRLDHLMVRPGLDINDAAAAASSSHRANLASWAAVCADPRARSAEIDRQLSTTAGQAALIATALSESATPTWAADCAQEIATTYAVVATIVSGK